MSHTIHLADIVFPKLSNSNILAWEANAILSKSMPMLDLMDSKHKTVQ